MGHGSEGTREGRHLDEINLTTRERHLQITDDMVEKAAVEIDAHRIAINHGESMPEARRMAAMAMIAWHAGHADNSHECIAINLSIIQARAALQAVLGDQQAEAFPIERW